jgi:hypothetical protein
MSNTLSSYNPIFYANEALTALEKALGMAGRVFRGYDDGNTARTRGQYIDITVPGSFSAQDGPSAAQDVTAANIQINLSSLKEVKFALTDKELAYSSERIINDHIRPAAYALADKIDQDLALLYKDVPWYVDSSSPMVVGDITGVRKVLFNNKVPLNDPTAVHFMIDGTAEKELLDVSAFTQNQGGGDAAVLSQMTGFLGTRYGINFFANQNVQTATSATVADLAGAVNNGAGYAAGIKTVVLDGISASAALKAGDIMLVTGHTQQYVLTADATADGSGNATVSFFGSPNVQGGGLEAAVVDNQVLTFVLSGTSGASKVQNLAFHRNAFTLAMAKLPDFYDGQGVRVFATPVDPTSRLSVRARTWADPGNDKFYVALDCLYGVKTLDGNKAVRFRD